MFYVHYGMKRDWGTHVFFIRIFVKLSGCSFAQLCKTFSSKLNSRKRQFCATGRWLWERVSLKEDQILYLNKVNSDFYKIVSILLSVNSGCCVFFHRLSNFTTLTNTPAEVLGNKWHETLHVLRPGHVLRHECTNIGLRNTASYASYN